jgi:DNA-binding transcriptional MerR regulator
MSEATLYGLCELARELRLPESTTRYYRDVFASYVPSVGFGRRRRYPEAALSVLRFVADAFASGRTRDEIAVALENGAAPGDGDSRIGPAEIAFPTRDEKPVRVLASLIDGEREQRELMWQMIRELSRFGDAIERQHQILSELVEHVFHSATRQLPAPGNGDELETVVDAEVMLEAEPPDRDTVAEGHQSCRDDMTALREALETERDLVKRLRQSKLELERRAAAAESELAQARDLEPSLLRRLFERDRGR